ncbi:MAG: DUF3131 domain-containing protein [Elusimicrobia bacterium]|nr:DUF3131 domain-containing protein [Elusimicrobiota bacterium]
MNSNPLKKCFLFLAFLPAWAHALAAKPPIPEAQQQARLLAFKPEDSKSLDLSLPDNALLEAIAKDTWVYFRDLVDRENGIPIDNVLVAGAQSRVGSFTSTTNIGLYLMSVAGAVEFGLISPGEAQARIRLVLLTLNKLDHWRGQYFNYYETITLDVSRRFASSVDNGWLAAGLIVARQSFPTLAQDIDRILEEMDFSRFYDPEIGQLWGGFDAAQNKPSTNHYGLLCTEPRIASYIGIAKGDLPREHWYRLFRVLPDEWDWQNQKPQGQLRTIGGQDVFYGTYSHNGIRYVPSWGGSLFEFLMPNLVLDEQQLSKRGLGANNLIALNAQIHYALQERRYPAWGMSPCATPDSQQGYKEYGVPYLGAKGYPDEGVVTPHVSFLALMVDAPQAIENIRRLARMKGLYGPYGFYDSVNVRTGRASARFLALDQSMTFISIVNYLKNGAIQKRFLSYPPIQEQLDLLRDEVFF